MYASLFEIKSWLGTDQYIFEGESASEMLSQFENVQSLECLVEMGRSHERSKSGKQAIDDLEKMLEKHYSDELEIEDLLKFDIKISLGEMRCITVVEGDDAIAQLRAEYPKAR